MRRAGLLLTAALLLPVSCGEGAEEGASREPDSSASGAGAPRNSGQRPPPRTNPEDAIFFLRPEQMELGQISNGTTREIEFEFENASDRQVSILRAETSCSKCLKVKLEEKHAKPGEKLIIKAEVRNKGTKAQVKVRCTLVLNNPKQKFVHAYVHFWAETQFSPRPRRFDFSQALVGEELSEVLEVGYMLPLGRPPLPLQPELVGDLPLRLEAEPTEAVEQEAHQDLVHRWRLVVDTSQPTAGEMIGAVVLKAEGFTDQNVPITLRVNSDRWYLDSARVHLGAVEPGGVKQRSMKVYYKADEAPPSARVRSELEGLSVEASVVHEAEKPHVLLEFNYTAPDAAGLVEGAAFLEADFASEPIEIPVAARVRRG